jgi:hypothetical protein
VDGGGGVEDSVEAVVPCRTPVDDEELTAAANFERRLYSLYFSAVEDERRSLSGLAHERTAVPRTHYRLSLDIVHRRFMPVYGLEFALPGLELYA